MNPCFAINPRSEHSGADAGKRGGLSFLICRRSASGGRSGSSCWNACQKMLHGLSVPAWLISDLVQVLVSFMSHYLSYGGVTLAIYFMITAVECPGLARRVMLRRAVRNFDLLQCAMQTLQREPCGRRKPGWPCVRREDPLTW
jgi:hypothetical protein